MNFIWGTDNHLGWTENACALWLLHQGLAPATGKFAFHLSRLLKAASKFFAQYDSVFESLNVVLKLQVPYLIVE